MRSNVEWRKVPALYSLGQCLSCTGDQSEDRKRLKRSWEAAFWRNSRVLTCKQLGLHSRLSFWGLLSTGIANFRFSMWAPACTAAKLLEGWHNLILRRIVRVSFNNVESPAQFGERRNRAVKAARDHANLSIQSAWSLCLVRWLEHLMRHRDHPASILLASQDDLWLATMRALSWTQGRDPTLRAGATCTRAGAGKPIRWGTMWVDALKEEFGLENPTRDPELTRQKAMMVQTMMAQGML